MTLDADAVDLPDDLCSLADRIEVALERAGRRGLTPSGAARTVKVDTSTAHRVLQWMSAHQFAHTDHRSPWSHYYPSRPD
jgi:hypothetical protein